MQKFFTKIFIIASIVIFLVLPGFISCYYVILNRLLARDVTSDLSHDLGFKVQLQQAPLLHIFPKMQLQLYGMALQKKQANKTTNLFETARIDIDLDFWQALFGKIKISKLKLYKPKFYIQDPLTGILTLSQKIFKSDAITQHNLSILQIEQGYFCYKSNLSAINDLNGEVVFAPNKAASYINIFYKYDNKKLALKTNAQYNDNGLNLNNIELASSDFNLKAILRLSKIANKVDKLAILGSVALDKIDNIAQLIDLLQQNYANIGQLDLRLSAKALNYNDLHINNFASTLQLDDNKLIFGIANAQTGKGNISGNLKISNFLTKNIISEFQLNLLGCDSQRLLPLSQQDLRFKGDINFTGSGELQLKDADFSLALWQKYCTESFLKFQLNILFNGQLAILSKEFAQEFLLQHKKDANFNEAKLKINYNEGKVNLLALQLRDSENNYLINDKMRNLIQQILTKNFI